MTSDSVSRREFLGLSAGAGIVMGAARAEAVPRIPRQGGIRFGYAAITWGGDDRRALDDIADVGFRGVQLRASAVSAFGERPEELVELLDARGLTLVALSSGLVRLAAGAEAEDLALHMSHARFVRAVGGLYLQVLDERPTGRAPGADDFRRMGRLLSELGRRTADIGIALGYHNHMGNLGQSPAEVERVLDAADPRYVKLELDTAHYRQAGGDPAEAVRRWRDRLLFLHIKDVESPVPGRGAASYRFVELGRGKVDFPAVFAALGEVRFEGWAVVELDSVPDRARTPKESAALSRAYLEETLGLKV